jgi:hypothetical protein
MFRSQVEKISSLRKIAVLFTNGLTTLSCSFLILGAPSIQARGLSNLRKKEVILAALNLLFMKISTPR